jgi:fructan beta-fructosidase
MTVNWIRCSLVLASLWLASCVSVDLARPQFHFTPAKNWINDPNGLVFVDGEYHLFFQYNPYGDKWGHMSWGHAISTDLQHWQELPVAIPEDAKYMIFSGSVVVDRNNSSGFGIGGKAPLVAIYTGNLQPDGGLQNQQLAYSNDRGRTWTKYAGNPVLDLGLKDFRDPKVFWYEPEQKWVMVAVLSDRRQATFYESRDLKHWVHLSDFGPAGFVGGIWECPDFFQLPISGESGSRWILKVDMFDGAVAGGSGGQVFVGSFDGKTFALDASADADADATSSAGSGAQWLDYGADFYAAASWSNIPPADGRQLWIGWMNDHHYAQYTPTTPWRGAMTMVREVTLRRVAGGLLVVQSPVREATTLRASHQRRANLKLADGELPLQATGQRSRALELAADFRLGTAREFGMKVAVGKDQQTVIGYDVATHSVFVDRKNSGQSSFSAAFAARHSAPLPLTGGKLKLRVFVDANSVEVFANDGERVLTEQIFPDAGSTGVRLYAKQGSVEVSTVEWWRLKSARVP